MSSSLYTQRQKEVKLAQVSLLLAIMMLSCHSLKWVPNIWELRQKGEGGDVDWPFWVQQVTHLSHLFTTLSGSSNVFIYFLKHRYEAYTVLAQLRGFFHRPQAPFHTEMLPLTGLNSTRSLYRPSVGGQDDLQLRIEEMVPLHPTLLQNHAFSISQNESAAITTREMHELMRN